MKIILYKRYYYTIFSSNYYTIFSSNFILAITTRIFMFARIPRPQQQKTTANRLSQQPCYLLPPPRGRASSRPPPWSPSFRWQFRGSGPAQRMATTRPPLRRRTKQTAARVWPSRRRTESAAAAAGCRPVWWQRPLLCFCCLICSSSASISF